MGIVCGYVAKSSNWLFNDTVQEMTTSMCDDFLQLVRSRQPRIVGIGEPLHGEQAFPRARNTLFRHLVEHTGFRTIAIESNSWAGRIVDAWVRGGPGDIDDVLTAGISHGFGSCPANRELLEWARAHNEGRPPSDQVRITGFDAPTEMTYADSPRAALARLHAFLSEHLHVPCTWETLDGLLGPDGPWTDEAVAMDPSLSVGADERVRELQAHAGDMARILTCETPALRRKVSPDELDDAHLAARCATGLLAYHRVMAIPGDPESRWQQMCALRDAMMADNLAALARRGPTFTFAHNQHLRTGTASLTMGPMTLRWQPAGAHLAERLGSDYLVVGSALGRSSDPEIPDPAPDTVEGLLSTLQTGSCLLPTSRLRGQHPVRETSSPAYFPLDQALLAELDAVLFVGDFT